MVSYQWSFLKATFRCFSNHAVPKLFMATFILYKGSLFGLASLSILLWTKSAVLLTGMPILGGKIHKDRCTKTYTCFPTTYFSDTPHVNITESKRQVAIIPKMENTPYYLPTCSLHCHSQLIMLSDYVSHIEKMKKVQLNKGMETEFENGEISEKMTGDTDARRKKRVRAWELQTASSPVETVWEGWMWSFVLGRLWAPMYVYVKKKERPRRPKLRAYRCLELRRSPPASTGSKQLLSERDRPPRRDWEGANGQKTRKRLFHCLVCPSGSLHNVSFEDPEE